MEAEGRRRSLSPEVVNRWGGEVQRHLAALPLFSAARTVAAYDAQGFEVPLGALCSELQSRGLRVCFPRIVKGSKELAFHEAASWAAGPLGLRQPTATSPRIELNDIDVWLVPGVAFTRDGRRLGRGAGYYDVTLASRHLNAARIGVAFELSVVPELETEAHDVPMQWLATELGVTRCS